jgi:hypothetical protein
MIFETKKDLRERIERMSRKTDELLEEINYFRKKTQDMENSGRIKGPHCTHCEHYGGDKLEFVNGTVRGTERCCLKAVPCADFERAGKRE